MKRSILFLFAVRLCAQTWTDLGAGTILKPNCPANGYNYSTCNNVAGSAIPGVCNAGSLPTIQNGITMANIPFADDCYNTIANESGGALDTKRNLLVFTGGGHGSTNGNAWYAVNPVTKTTTMVKAPSVFDNVETTAACLQSNCQTSYTDLVIDGSNPNKVTSASHSFVSGDVYASSRALLKIWPAN